MEGDMFASQPPADGLDGRQDEPTAIVVHGNGFARDCIVKTISAELAPLRVQGVGSVDELPRNCATQIALILIETSGTSLADPAVVERLEKVKLTCPGVPIIVLSDRDSAVLKAMSLGIRGFLSSSDNLGIGIAALRLILAGGNYFSHVTEMALNQQLHETSRGEITSFSASAIDLDATASVIDTNQISALTHGITKREAQVLAFLQHGLPNKSIANQLSLSENTVKVHVRRLMQKLNARNRTEVVLASQRFQ
ncbi:response regulator transcription factor [Bradyrhizobium sp.]|uniref:helix-turn-helix transcriptional regulator n=1 Tax=Bradyrhizobium sp. TaxID=376 RepID=UPI0025C15D0A|nr:response regulator transcription factor [Bradyrhizobium sp.]